MLKIKPSSLGLTLGSFAAIIHVVWSILLFTGWAKPLIDFKMSMHSIQMNYSLTAFSLSTSVILVIMTFIGGYVVGIVLAALWNTYAKRG